MFGKSFDDVNIHKNDDNATNMGALAYTQGSDIHFAPGQFSPDTQKGQELIGHELTHTIQQKKRRVQQGVPSMKKSIPEQTPKQRKKEEQRRETKQMQDRPPNQQM